MATTTTRPTPDASRGDEPDSPTDLGPGDLGPGPGSLDTVWLLVMLLMALKKDGFLTLGALGIWQVAPGAVESLHLLAQSLRRATVDELK